MPRDILHCDMNNFYASVECMLDPALKKYPVAVCGSVEESYWRRTIRRKPFMCKQAMQYGRHSRSVRD